jgi:MFS family permease
VGPAVAGFLIGITGEADAFLVNGLSYVAVLLALFAMHLPPAAPRTHTPAMTRHLREGLAYAFGFTPIRAILLLIALVSLVGVPFMVLMPIFAAEVLHGGPHMLGLLTGAVGLGALAGALVLAARRTVVGLGNFITTAGVLLGCGLVGFSLATHATTAVLTLFVAGFGMMTGMASSNTILQTIVDDDKRGRVMSLYTMAYMGTIPFGSLLAGALAHRIGAPMTVRLGGILCIVGALSFARALPALRAKVRPLYLRMGLLPDASTPIEDGAAGR